MRAFDLIELDGEDLRFEPLEVRKATLASLLEEEARVVSTFRSQCGALISVYV